MNPQRTHGPDRPESLETSSHSPEVHLVNVFNITSLTQQNIFDTMLML
jgi:hypothetical protein